MLAVPGQTGMLASGPVLQNTFAGWFVAPQLPGTPPKATECQREGVSMSLSQATTLVKIHAQSQETVSKSIWISDIQALGGDITVFATFSFFLILQ